MRLVIFDGTALTDVSADATIASGSGSATLVFPENTATTARTYTIKASLDGGATYLDAPTATVTVNGTTPAAPTIAGPASLTLAHGYAATSSDAFTVAGNPVPTVTKTTGDAKITWNDAAKRLEIASGLDAGTYPVTLAADNGVAPAASHAFTLTVRAAERTYFSIDSTEWEIRYYRLDDGRWRVEISIPFADRCDPSLLATIRAILSFSTATDIAYSYVDENGDEHEIPEKSAASRGAVSAPYLKIAFTVDDRTVLDTGKLTAIEYSLINDAIEYVQSYPGTDGSGLPLSQIAQTDTTPAAGSSGVGCGMGFGALALLAAASLAICRKKRTE